MQVALPVPDARKARQLASLVVLVLAGLASLANEPGRDYYTDARGTVEVGSEGGQLDFTATMSQSLSDAVHLTISTSGTGATPYNGQVAVVPLEARFVATDLQPETPSDWMMVPASKDIDPKVCTQVVRGQCALTYRIDLRPVAPITGPFVVQWHLTGIATNASSFSEPPVLRLTANSSLATVSIIVLEVQGALVGVLLGLAVLALAAFAPRGRRLAIAEGASGLVLLAASAFVLEGVIVQGLPTLFVAIVIAGEGVAILASQLLFAPRLRRPRYIATLIGLLAPITTGFIVLAGAYRSADVLVAVAAGAALLAMAPILLAPNLREIVGSLDVGRLRTWFVVTVGLLEIGMLVYLAALIAAGETWVGVGSALLLDVGAATTAIALWFWLGRNPWPIVAVGVGLPIGVILLFGSLVMSALGYMYTERPPSPPLFFESLALIAGGGISLAVFGALRPREKAVSS